MQLLQSVGDSASGDVQSARNRTVSTGSGQRWVSTASTVAVGMGRNACAIIHGHVAAARAPSGRHGGGTSSRPSPIQPVLSCFWPWTRPVRRELYRTQPPACPVPRRVDQRHLLRQRWRRCSTASDRVHGIAKWPLCMHLHSSAGFSKCHCHRAHTARHGAATLTPPPRPWAWGPPPCSDRALSTPVPAPHGSYLSFPLAGSRHLSRISLRASRADAVATRSSRFAAPDDPRDMSGHACTPAAGPRSIRN